MITKMVMERAKRMKIMRTERMKKRKMTMMKVNLMLKEKKMKRTE